MDPASLPLTVESGYPAALAVATQWASDAQLLSVSMQIDWPLTIDPQSPIALPPGGWMTFTFYRPAGDTHHVAETLGLFYERTSGALVDQHTLAWPSDIRVSPVNPQALSISSAAAVMTVEARTGRAWRSACPVERHMTRVSLTAGKAGVPTWVVTYADARINGVGLLAHINARTGELTRVDDRSQDCAGA